MEPERHEFTRGGGSRLTGRTEGQNISSSHLSLEEVVECSFKEKEEKEEKNDFKHTDET